jgi:VanZ family protein
MNSPSQRLFIAWLPALLWATLIFLLSAMSYPPKPGPDFPFKDKLGHVGIYAVLGWLIVSALHRGHGLALPKAAALAIVLVAAYGASDEWHQSFTPNRHNRVTDVVIDTVGGSLAIASFYAYESHRSAKARRQSA